MSILVKGMEMPIVCEGERERCRFADFYFGDKTYYLTGDYIEKGKLNENCPLVPVPPHGRLGDLDALAQQIEHERFHHTHTDGLAARHHVAEYGHFLKAISDAPTIIPAEEGET